ncbi:MAG: class I SAM-dependent methyltransferase [Spirochaetes bacterium]|nr:class I SAM-dependent methyltransferase [Spirochaetota bacterium]
MTKNIRVELGNIQKTLLLPLWGRAFEYHKKQPLLIDKTANEIINKISYDFSAITKNISEISQIGWIARSLIFDKIIKQFIKKHPEAIIVNIGCGLDTTFERIDNGHISWYDLDLRDVIELRKKFIKETKRRKFIISSFFDNGWIKKLGKKNNILFIAAGVFYYFEESQIKEFFIKIAHLFPGSEIAFDATSNIKMANKMVIKSGGMDEKSFLRWGLKNSKNIELWDNKIKILNEYPMFRDITKSNLNLKNKIGTFISDLLKMQYIVHFKII